MNARQFFFAFSLALVIHGAAVAAGNRKMGLTVPVRYEGGTLPLNQGRIKATIAEDEVTFVHGNQRLAIPVQNITVVSCGTEVRRRMGASVLGMVPLMHLEKTELYYIGLTWTGGKAAKTEVVLKLTSGEYRDFLAALERLTGRKAVNTDKIPTTVRYEL